MQPPTLHRAHTPASQAPGQGHLLAEQAPGGASSPSMDFAVAHGHQEALPSDEVVPMAAEEEPTFMAVEEEVVVEPAAAEAQHTRGEPPASLSRL